MTGAPPVPVAPERQARAARWLLASLGLASIAPGQSPTWLRAPVLAGRSGTAMAYDSARQRIVLFGGLAAHSLQSGERADTWEWNGAAWIERQTPTRPPARAGH